MITAFLLGYLKQCVCISRWNEISFSSEKNDLQKSTFYYPWSLQTNIDLILSNNEPAAWHEYVGVQLFRTRCIVRIDQKIWWVCIF